MAAIRTLQLDVNGSRRRVTAQPGTSLLHILREQLDLTAAKPACAEGECGACTILIGGQSARSCVTPADAAVGKRVTTIEGLARDGRLHPLQQAFLDAQALQCGYCTPGMIMSSLSLLNAIAQPTDHEIAAFMQGNICRCGSYPRIVVAIHSAARAMSSGADG